MLVFIFLHAFFEFFDFCGVTQNVHQLHNFHIFVICFCKGIFDPFIRLSANIHEQVAGGYFQYIVSGGLIVVQVNAVVQQISDLCIVSMLTENFLCPVIFREDGAYHAE